MFVRYLINLLRVARGGYNVGKTWKSGPITKVEVRSVYVKASLASWLY